jgi:hypothetical protein
MANTLIVGPQKQGDGQPIFQRAGTLGDTITSNLHGKYTEQTMRGNVYSFGISNTALSSTTAIATGLTASATPILALYNPLGNPYFASIIKATVVVSTVAASAVAPGGFQWVFSTNNAAISTGSAPINMRTLAAAGSAMKAFAISTALTGLSTNLAFLRASAISSCVNAAGAVTAVSLPQGVPEELVDGSIIVPPGCVVGLMNQISTTTISVSVALTWEEVPLP